MKLQDKQKTLLLNLFNQETDGSLPEMSIRFEDADHLKEAMAFLSAHGHGDMKNLNEFVTEEQHMLLHHLFDLPDLGACVLGNTINLDFRTGKSWSRKSIESLVRVLDEMKLKYKATRADLDEEGIFFPMNEREFFSSCFN